MDLKWNLKKKGILITIHSLRKHIAASHNKIGIAMFEGKNRIYDDNGKNCIRNTTVHNPLDSNEISMSETMNNKAKGSDVIFNEEFIFLRNFPILHAKNE